MRKGALLAITLLLLLCIPVQVHSDGPYTIWVYVSRNGQPQEGATMIFTNLANGQICPYLEAGDGWYGVNLQNINWNYGDTVLVEAYYNEYYGSNSTVLTHHGQTWGDWLNITLLAPRCPDEPWNPSPSDGATQVSLSPLLTVHVSDPNGDIMDVYFYDASNDSLIGVDTNVLSGGVASISWDNLTYSTTYSWYTVADDGTCENQSDTWSFTTRPPTNYTLEVSETPRDSGIFVLDPPGGTYIENTVVSVLAVPAANYTFDYWSGDASGSNNPLSVTMDRDRDIVAHFSLIHYTLTAEVEPPGTGSITLNPSGGDYPTGTEVTVTAHPGPGYLFSHWGGDLSGSDNPQSLIMDANKSITAHFIVNIPPVVTIAYPDEEALLSGIVTIEGNAHDGNGNETLQRVEVKIDDGNWSDASGTTQWTYVWNTTGTEDGDHIIYARAYDGVNYSSVVQRNVTVRNIPPPETILSLVWSAHPQIPKNNETVAVMCINDGINFTVSYNNSTTYYRWMWWNQSSGGYESYPLPDTPGAVLGETIGALEHSEYIESYWWMPYTGNFTFTEGCNHTLYYFSIDEEGHAEMPNEWYVGVDDEAPDVSIEFDNSSSGSWIFYGEDDTIYFQNCTWFIINATDYPNNTDCQTGIWKIHYRILKWNGSWEELIPWTEAPSNSSESPYEGVVYHGGSQYGYFSLSFNLSEIDHASGGTGGMYEIHWVVWDYNNMTRGEHAVNVVVDSTPPVLTKEVGTPHAEGIYGPTTWLANHTMLWLNATEVSSTGEAGIREAGYEIWWKENCTNESEAWNTTRYPVVIVEDNGEGDRDPTEGNISVRLTLEYECCHEIHYWAVDKVGNEVWKNQTHLVDTTPPVSRVDEIVPYEREETPFDITVVDIQDFGCGGESGGAGICRVEVYYLYDADNESWGDNWVLYVTNTTPATHPDGTADNWTFSFDAPEGGGFYRFKSVAYDCLDNAEVSLFSHGTYDAACEHHISISISFGEPQHGEWIAPATPITISSSIGDILYYRIYNNGTWHPQPGEGVGNGNNFYRYEGPFTLGEYGGTHGEVRIECYVNGTGIATASRMLDTTPPSTDFSLPYLLCTLHGAHTVTPLAHDEGSGVAQVALYHRFSYDNDTWGDWIFDQMVDGEPFILSIPAASGFYQLSTVAVDFLGNTEQQEVKEVVRVFTPDFNGDGVVSVQDLVLMAHHFGGTASAEHRARYDIDGDGMIDLDDAAIVLHYWS